jgi:hypothetical protein
MNMEPLEHYLRPPPRHTGWLLLFIFLLLAGAAWVGMLAEQQNRVVQRLNRQHADLLALQASRAVPAPSHQQVEEQKKWAQLRTERDFPWDNVFHAIEKVATPDIELLEFRPDKLNGQIVLKGEARNLKSLLDYLQALSDKSGWSEVHLAHQQTVQRGALETISFEIKATLTFK